MRTPSNRFAWGLSIALLLGCANSPPTVHRTTSTNYAPLSPNAEVRVYSADNRPPHGYDEIGTTRQRSIRHDMTYSEAVELAKTSARQQGGDVLIYRGSQMIREADPLSGFGEPVRMENKTVYEFVVARARPAPPTPTAAPAPVVVVNLVSAPAAVSGPATAAAIFCSNCGTRFGEVARFCGGCGASRPSPPAAPPAAAAPATTTTTTATAIGPATESLPWTGEIVPGPDRLVWYREDHGEEPGLGRAVSVPAGAIVHVLERKGEMLRVRVRLGEGWIEAMAVRSIEPRR